MNDAAGTCSVATVESNEGAAIAACTSVLQHAQGAEERAHAYKLRGRAFLRTKRLDEAIRDLDAGIGLNPRDPDLRVLRGWTAYTRHDLEGTVRYVQEALAVDPEYAAAYDLFGKAWASIGDFKKAKAATDKAIALAPQNPRFRFHRFELFDNFGDPKNALKEADALLALPEREIAKDGVTLQGLSTTYRTGIRLLKADVLWKLERLEEVQAVLDEAVESDPSAASLVWRGRFRRFRQNGDFQADLDRALELAPNSWLIHLRLAETHYYRGRYELAIAGFSRAAELNPKSGLFKWLRAKALRDLGRIDEAVADAVSAVEDRAFLRSRAEMLVKLGYLHPPKGDGDLREAARDAARACMMDERCR